MELLQVALLLAVLAATLLWWRIRSNKQRCLPPGPPALPIVGNLLDIRRTRNAFEDLVRGCREKYGPIFTIWFGQTPFILIADRAMAHQALIKQSAVFADRPKPGGFRKMFSSNGHSVNSAAHGPLWRSLRSNMVSGSLSHSSVAHFSSTRDWAVGKLIETLAHEAEQNGGIVQPREQRSITIVLNKAAVETTKGNTRFQKQWYDMECKKARLALKQTQHRDEALRQYKNLIRNKKRQHIKERQKMLVELIKKDSKSFWKLLKAKLGPSHDIPFTEAKRFYLDLFQGDNYNRSVKCSAGNTLTVTQEEVQEGIQRLASDKAMDSEGMYAELLKYGGPIVWRETHRMINDAFKEGLIDMWKVSRAVMLHKKGDKNDLNNYRLIVISNIFAKLVGTILEKKLGDWAEENKKRAISQAGFRHYHSTIDQLVTLRHCMEAAKGNRNKTFICFVDFSKAYDSVVRDNLWRRLMDIDVPMEITTAIQKLYEEVVIELRDLDTTKCFQFHSNIGVKQGCPLSPTLFGIFIDELEEWMQTVPEEHAIKIGDLLINMLLFADDVALISKSSAGLQMMLQKLEGFCARTGMKINAGKTKVMIFGTRQSNYDFKIGDASIEVVNNFKYLGVECTSNYKWNSCVSHRVAGGMKALHALRNKLSSEGIWTWKLRKQVFNTVVRSTVLYGCAMWGPGLAEKWWKKIEHVQKIFLLYEFRVKKQTPYEVMLLEGDMLPLEVEALCQFIAYVQKVTVEPVQKFSREVLEASKDKGWLQQGKLWMQKWNVQEEILVGNKKDIRALIRKKALTKLWHTVEGKKKFYLEHIRGNIIEEQVKYLEAAIPTRLKTLIGRIRMSSHHLRVETGRWCNLPREQRICRLCQNEVEDECHVFLWCFMTNHYRTKWNINCQNLYELFKLPPLTIGHFFEDVLKHIDMYT